MALIAVDAMGGDEAPVPEVAGAVLAAKRGHRVILLGDEPLLRRQLAQLKKAAGEGPFPDLPIRHTTEIITMRDQPGQAVRKKRDSSMRVAFELVKRGEADAVVSCGNSGAMLACGLLVLGRIKGVERPGIIVTFPTLLPSGQTGECAFLDTGANSECKPIHLLHFAVLGATFMRLHKGRMRPRVGLLSNGEEEEKGTEGVRQAHELLKDGRLGSLFDYVGPVEGRDIFCFDRDSQAPLDVVVTDGFTGNVVLKSAEGAARMLTEVLKGKIRSSRRSMLGALLMKPALTALRHVVDVERRGGALLIGVSGVVVICHGRSTDKAIASAIALADEQADAGITPALVHAIESLSKETQ